MGCLLNDEIPWGMSEYGPHRLKTLKDMTPEEAERAREAGIRWAQRWAKEEPAKVEHEEELVTK